MLQKASTCDAMCINYKDTFAMGTSEGAELLDLTAGKIEKGYLADFVGIAMDDMSMQPISENLEQVLPNLVYSMQPTAIREVVVNGRTTVHEGKLCNVSETEIIEKVQAVMKQLQS